MPGFGKSGISRIFARSSSGVIAAGNLRRAARARSRCGWNEEWARRESTAAPHPPGLHERRIGPNRGVPRHQSASGTPVDPPLGAGEQPRDVVVVKDPDERDGADRVDVVDRRQALQPDAVSYTHLTLPTILRV